MIKIYNASDNSSEYYAINKEGETTMALVRKVAKSAADRPIDGHEELTGLLCEEIIRLNPDCQKD